MGLFKDLVSEFSHSGDSSSSYQQQPSYGSAPPQPPPVQPPWVARWDNEAGRWIFINEQTGARTFEHPGNSYQEAGYYQGGPPPQQGYGGGYGGGGYGGGERVEYVEEEKKSSGGNGLMYGAIGAAADLAGGALLMHEGEKVAEDWDEDKARLEQKVDHGVENVEEFPENAARWTGEAIGTVEDIPQDVEQSWDRTEDRVEQGWDNAENRVEQGWDNAENNVEQGWDSTVEAVEDAPENAAEWVGEGVGKVERFGDDVEDYGDSLEQSYDEGRDEARYDDY
ncbi:ww domain protein [Botryosphaeria dothidea]|uniref:Ww domain protein n=1 Tax=Botryosphaeria dothidea TaxID=55169 RepID=A0A8H4IIB6_9PEZI|nr:ww domain protein [Botryosphaeria dothidea]